MEKAKYLEILKKRAAENPSNTALKSQIASIENPLKEYRKRSAKRLAELKQKLQEDPTSKSLQEQIERIEHPEETQAKRSKEHWEKIKVGSKEVDFDLIEILIFLKNTKWICF